MKSTYHLYIWRDSGKEVKQFIVVNCIGTPKLFCKFIDAWKNDNYWNLHSLLLKTHFWQMNLSDLKISIKLPFSLEWLSLFLLWILPLSFPTQWLLFFSLYFSGFLCRKKKKGFVFGKQKALGKNSQWPYLLLPSLHCYCTLVSHLWWKLSSCILIGIVFKARSLIYWFSLFKR